MPKQICGEYAVYLEDSECPDVYVEFRDFSDPSQAMQFISWLEEVLEASTQMALMPDGESIH
jgi:hypothetical protein